VEISLFTAETLALQGIQNGPLSAILDLLGSRATNHEGPFIVGTPYETCIMIVIHRSSFQVTGM